ncbi:hypothetical protein [Dickeya lacustris]|uniref:Uncharacterized protein n=1 Tax=Dickeya lacustris TaxID=2259638 RepID=A0ABY8G8T0_9GAMM|nr:hypothetical protein [Dickeya lacustris]WFN56375.1 hypothetical protein O1Q98_03450 [Dickeya lacustris]
MIKSYALIKNDHYYVENTITADENFTLQGHYLIEISEENPAQPGAYYNPADGKFYGDAAYTTDYRTPPFPLNGFVQ